MHGIDSSKYIHADRPIDRRMPDGWRASNDDDDDIYACGINCILN
jgi:hypothetical protein